MFIMGQYLLLANPGVLLKVSVNTDPNLDIPDSTSIVDATPEDTYTIPTGECKRYAFNKTWIYTTDNYIVEVNPDGVYASIKLNYDASTEEFRHCAHLVTMYIMNYIVARNEEGYKQDVSTYMCDAVFNDNEIDLDAYHRFVKLEEEINNVKDHISAYDLTVEKYMSSYSTHEIPDITVLDVTGASHIFDHKSIFFI